MITSRGFLYGLVCFISLLVLMYTGSDIFLYLLFLMLTLPPLSALLLFITLKGLKYAQTLDSETIERQAKAGLTISLRQKGFFSLGLVDITVLRPQPDKGSAYSTHRIPVLTGNTRNLNLEISCPHRGVFKTGITRIWARDLFGLFWLPIRSRRRCRRELLTLTVMPREIDLTQREKLAGMLDHLQQQMSPQFGTELNDIANLRAQIPGDALKRVHWKLSARLNQTMIKEYEKPQQQDILMLWHIEKIPLQGIAEVDYLDTYADIAASTARDILATGSFIRCVNYSKSGRRQLEAGRSENLKLVKIELAGIEWSGDIPVAGILKEEAGPEQQIKMLLLFTTNLKPDMLDALRQIRMQGIEVMLVLIPAASPDALIRRRLEQMEDEGITAWIPILFTDEKSGEKQRTTGQKKRKNEERKRK